MVVAKQIATPRPLGDQHKIEHKIENNIQKQYNHPKGKINVRTLHIVHFNS